MSSLAGADVAPALRERMREQVASVGQVFLREPLKVVPHGTLRARTAQAVGRMIRHDELAPFQRYVLPRMLEIVPFMPSSSSAANLPRQQMTRGWSASSWRIT